MPSPKRFALAFLLTAAGLTSPLAAQVPTASTPYNSGHAPIPAVLASQAAPAVDALPTIEDTTPAVTPLPPPAADGPCEFVFPSPPPTRAKWCHPDMLQVIAGAYYTTEVGPDVPEYNYAPITARVGWYLNPRCSPGSLVFLVDYTTGIVVSGFGNYFTGPSLLLRYERWPDEACIPYAQVGGGVVYNDAYRDLTQRAIGQAAEFYLQVGLGVRYRITECWSVDLEAAFQHISNARLAERNAGINTLGVSAGMTYTFGRPR